jgi:predicted signal transduction protein with EAL and GGDEF domain
MPVVDVSTIIIVLILGHCLSIFFLAFDLFQYETTKYDYLFLSGRVLQAIAWGLIVVREVLPLWLSFSVGNSILFLGWMLEALAVISLKYVVTARCVSVYAFTVILAQLALWPFSGLEQTVSVLVASFLGALIFLIPGGVLLFSQHKSSSLQKVLGAMYCSCCVAFIWRGVDIWLQVGYWLFAARLSQIVALLVLEGVLLLGAIGYVLVKKEKLSREMKTFADTDHLTSLYNRRAFLLLANQLIESAISRNESVALLIIDIDHFKRINDRYGHGVGDGIIAKEGIRAIEDLKGKKIAIPRGSEAQVMTEWLLSASSLSVSDVNNLPGIQFHPG